MNSTYKSFLANDIEDYIALKCSLGYSATTYSGNLQRFDRYCIEIHPDEHILTRQIVEPWLEKRPSENTNGHIRRMIAINGFLTFLKTRHPETYMIPEGIIGQYKPFVPYLYSDEEMDSFFLAADTIPIHPEATNRELICPVIFRMLYCCGLRPQEPLKIKCTDIDYQAGTLYIADSKVHKDRIVSMSDDMRNLCVKYNDIMDSYMPGREYFFQRPDGKPYNALWLQRTFRTCIRHSGLKFHGQSPRVYDWRHNFATRVIRKWLQEGLDIASNLPRLSAYMGHTSLENTAYYIHLVPEHLEEHRMNEWSCIPEVPSYED